MTMHERNEGEDAEVQAHLREVSPLPAYTAEDWDRLGRSVLLAAEPVFEARTLRPSWGDDMVRLSRFVIPMALAAGLAALVILNRIEASASQDAAPASAFLSAMAGETTRETVLDLTLGQNSQGLLLADGR
jgi:hypothetical protein